MPDRSPPFAAPLPLLTADEMRRWDRRAVEVVGIPEPTLLETAGRAAAAVLHRLFPSGRVAAAVGRGNNGGDAVVMLRALRAWGRDVVAVPVGGAEPAAELLHGWQLPVASEGEAESVFRGADVLVDGILGTGARGAPRDAQAAAVRALAAAERPVVALDGPTGVDMTTGHTPGVAVRAAVTVTFGAPKRGLLLYPGRAHSGRLVVVEVGFPPLLPAEWGAALVTAHWARARLPALPPNAHKGTAGAVTVVAGRRGMAGASVLAAMGALRAGAGMVRLVGPEENRLVLQGGIPEALFVDRGDDGQVDAALDAADALVVGPGMGTDDESLALLRRALDRAVPTLLDADALSLVAREPDLIAPAAARLLLTPHPGELGRMLGRDTAIIVGDPFAAAAEAATRWHCVVLLKGAPSVVAAPEQPTLVNTTGHAGVATGGMGDTLAGVAGALLAAGAPPRDAAALALFFAGRAAELAGRGRGLLPRDVSEDLPRALAEERVERSDLAPGVLLDLAPPGPAAR